MSPRPNILVFMVDQLRYDACGCFGSTVCQTPHLDRLASEGMGFTHAFASVPLCTPTRASFWSGLWPSHHGVLINTHWQKPVTKNRLDRSVPILSEVLKGGGRQTAHFGKWHVGPDSEMSERGFDHVVTRTDFQSQLKAQGKQFEVRDRISRDYIIKDYPFAGITSAEDEDFFEIWLCRRAEEWLRAQASSSQPFFCCVSTPGPHPGYVVPESYALRYDPAKMPLWPNVRDDLGDRPAVHRLYRDVIAQCGDLSDDEWRTCVARYYAFITLIDDQFGRLLALLDELHLSENTLVLFVSDHGDLIGAHGLFDKGPMMYDEQLHIPLVARWPGVVPAGEKCDAMITFLDLMPTLVDAAGLALTQPVDGRSLLPFLRGDSVSGWPEDVYCQYNGEGISLYSVRAVRSRRYKYVYYPYDQDELYDEQSDPWEMHNLANEPSAAPILEDMKQRLVRWMESAEDVMVDWNVNLTPKRRSF